MYFGVHASWENFCELGAFARSSAGLFEFRVVNISSCFLNFLHAYVFPRNLFIFMHLYMSCRDLLQCVFVHVVAGLF